MRCFRRVQNNPGDRGCQSPGKKITGVPKKKTLKKGKKWSIKAKATPKNVAKLTYKSSDKKVASVNGKGVVKAKKNGKATITIKADSLKKTCKITVK